MLSEKPAFAGFFAVDPLVYLDIHIHCLYNKNDMIILINGGCFMRKISFFAIALIVCAAFFSCSLNSNVPKILSNVRHQYDSESEEHTFFWQFYNKFDKPIEACVTINITISNDKQEEVFNKDFQVTESDYGTRTSQNYPDGELFGSIVIPDSEIEAGVSGKGKATITATFDKGYFEPVIISVDDLPQKDVTIHLPQLPIKSDHYGNDRWQRAF